MLDSLENNEGWVLLPEISRNHPSFLHPLEFEEEQSMERSGFCFLAGKSLLSLSPLLLWGCTNSFSGSGERGQYDILERTQQPELHLSRKKRQDFGNTCQMVQWSADRRKMFFRMDGRGTGGEHDGPDEVVALARKDALERVLRCSGERQILESFYDNTYQIGGRSGQVLSRDLFETMAAFSRDETIFRKCRIRGKSLACRIRIQGWIRIESADPSFVIRSFGMGNHGVFREGETLTVRFRLTRPARTYLFDVEENGQANLLFPTPLSGRMKNPLPAGKLLSYPLPGSRTVLRVRLPEGRTRTLERLVIVALHKGSMDFGEKSEASRNGRKKGAREKLYVIGDFRKTVLENLYRRRGPGREWTMREIPFEIVRSKIRETEAKPKRENDILLETPGE